MTRNSIDPLASKPKRTIKPTAKIASILEEEEESSGPEDPNLQKSVHRSDNRSRDDYKGNSKKDNNSSSDDEGKSGEEEEEEEVLPVVVPQKRKNASQRTNKSIFIFYSRKCFSYQKLLQIRSLETMIPVTMRMKK
jgi:hypothetical protein